MIFKIKFFLLFLLVSLSSLFSTILLNEDFEGNTDSWTCTTSGVNDLYFYCADEIISGSSSARFAAAPTETNMNTAVSNVIHIEKNIIIPSDTKYLKLRFRTSQNGNAYYDNYLRVYVVPQNYNIQPDEIIPEEYAISEEIKTATYYNEFISDVSNYVYYSKIVFSYVTNEYNEIQKTLIDEIELEARAIDEGPYPVKLHYPREDDGNIPSYGSLTWKPVVGASDYLVNLGTNGNGTATPNNIFNSVSTSGLTSIDFHSLESATTYYWQIIPVDESGTIPNDSPIHTFVTAEYSVNPLPFYYDFNQYYNPDWKSPSGSELALKTYFKWRPNNNWRHDDRWMISDGIDKCYYKQIGYDHYAWLISPLVAIGESSKNISIEFDLKISENLYQTVLTDFRPGEELKVLYKQSDTAYWSSNNVIAVFNNQSTIDTTTYHVSVPLNDISGNVKFAIYFEHGSSCGNYLMIDNFSVAEVEELAKLSCPNNRYNFNNIQIGQTKTHNFTITNNGNTDLVIENVVTSDQFNYEISNSTIPPYTSTSLGISLSPTDVGEINEVITIESNSLLGDSEINILANSYAEKVGENLDNPIIVEFSDNSFNYEHDPYLFLADYRHNNDYRQDVFFKISVEDAGFYNFNINSSISTGYSLYNADLEEKMEDIYSLDAIIHSGNGDIENVPLVPGTYFICLKGDATTYQFSFTAEFSYSPAQIDNFSGQVIDLVTEEPINRAMVKIPALDLTTMTNQNGEFSIDGTFPDTLSINIVDFSSQHSGIFNHAITYNPDSSYSFGLTPYRYGKVNGYVKDINSNDPISNIKVQSSTSICRTDENGYYEFPYHLTGFKKIECQTTAYNKYEDFIDTTDQDSVYYDILMEPKQFCEFSGTVYDNETNEPVSFSKVFFGYAEVEADVNGTYFSNTVLYDSLKVSAAAKDYLFEYSGDDIPFYSQEIDMDFHLTPCSDAGDTYEEAMFVGTNFSEREFSFYNNEDADWFYFYTDSLSQIEIEVSRSELSDFSNRVYLYGPVNLSYSNIHNYIIDDICNADSIASIEYVTEEAGYYFIKIGNSNRNGSSYPFGNYLLSINCTEFTLFPPTYLTAEAEICDVNLSWYAPEILRDDSVTRNSRNSIANSREYTHYRIYRDSFDSPVGEVNFTNTTFSERVIEGGIHTYYVTAVYEDSLESVPSNIVEVETPIINSPYDLTAEISEDNVILQWSIDEVEEEIATRNKRNSVNSSRELTGYKIYRDNDVLVEIGTLASLIYYDTNAPTSGEHSYFVKAIYYGDVESDSSNVVTITFTDNENTIPIITELSGNYPNPFNPETSIKYSMSKDDEINISIYNIKGQLVKTLIDEHQESGHHEVIWNGKDNKNKQTSSGVYFMKMETSEYKKLQKMLLMK